MLRQRKDPVAVYDVTARSRPPDGPDTTATLPEASAAMRAALPALSRPAERPPAVHSAGTMVAARAGLAPTPSTRDPTRITPSQRRSLPMRVRDLRGLSATVLGPATFGIVPSPLARVPRSSGPPGGGDPSDRFSGGRGGRWMALMVGRLKLGRRNVVTGACSHRVPRRRRRSTGTPARSSGRQDGLLPATSPVFGPPGRTSSGHQDGLLPAARTDFFRPPGRTSSGRQDGLSPTLLTSLRRRWAILQ